MTSLGFSELQEAMLFGSICMIFIFIIVFESQMGTLFYDSWKCVGTFFRFLYCFVFLMSKNSLSKVEHHCRDSYIGILDVFVSSVKCCNSFAFIWPLEDCVPCCCDLWFSHCSSIALTKYSGKIVQLK